MLYTLVFDGDSYRLMLWDKEQIASIVDDKDIDHLIDINGAPIRHRKVFKEPLRVSFAAMYPGDAELKIPDLCVFEGRLYLNEKAHQILGKIIENDGEFLEVIDDKGKPGFVFTPLRVAEDVDGLNTQLSRKNEWGEVQHLAFDESKVRTWSVFRTQFNGYMTLHCREDIKGLIESETLSGVICTNDLGTNFHYENDTNAQLN